VLYDLDTRDIRRRVGRGRERKVFVLFTPVVNGITPRDQCATSS